MNNLGTIRSELEAALEALLTGPKLPVNEALARLSNVVDLAGDYTLKLEAAGRLAEAATWYKKVAQAFEATAQKMPEEDRQRIASLSSYWLLKAHRVTVEPAPEPPPYIEQRRDPTTDHSSLKIHHQGLKLETDKPGRLTPAKPHQAVDLEKPGGVQVGRGTRVRTSPFPVKARTLLSSEQVEKGTREHQSTRTKRLDLDRDSEDTPAPEKGA